MSGGIGRRTGVESRGGYISQIYSCKVQILTSFLKTASENLTKLKNSAIINI